MKRKISKILKLFLIILLIFIVHKIYHLVVIRKFCDSINDFKELDNRIYIVNLMENENIRNTETVLKYGNIIKYTEDKIDDMKYSELINFDTDDKIGYYSKNNKVYVEDLIVTSLEFCPNLPYLYLDISDKLNFESLFDIYCIIPSKYNDEKCYKIVTRYEEIYIGRETYLPVCKINKKADSENQEERVEYSFTIGETKQEDMIIPELQNAEFNK